MKFFRKMLEPNVEEIVDLNSQHITIINLGPNNVHINIDAEATTESLVIPPNFGRSLFFRHVVKNVHVIAEADTLVQIDGLE